MTVGAAAQSRAHPGRPQMRIGLARRRISSRNGEDMEEVEGREIRELGADRRGLVLKEAAGGDIS